MEAIYDIWARRNPKFEIRYQDTIFSTFTDYGKGVSQYQDARGKIFGAGYEIYIIAFFIGLYNNQRKPLIEDSAKTKVLGQPIMYWGNIEERAGRRAYPKIREYIFAALVARTDVDWFALEKGDISARDVASKLIDTMEEYTNFGLDFIQEKLEQNPNYFFKETGFLDVFTSFLKQENEDNLVSDEPEDLD